MLISCISYYGKYLTPINNCWHKPHCILTNYGNGMEQ